MRGVTLHRRLPKGSRAGPMRRPPSRLCDVAESLLRQHRCLPVTWQGVTLIGLYFAMKRAKVPLFDHLVGLPDRVSAGQHC